MNKATEEFCGDEEHGVDALADMLRSMGLPSSFGTPKPCRHEHTGDKRRSTGGKPLRRSNMCCRLPAYAGHYVEQQHRQESSKMGEEEQYFYLDPQGVQQGPFRLKQLQQWRAAGYFPDSTPVRHFDLECRGCCARTLWRT